METSAASPFCHKSLECRPTLNRCRKPQEPTEAPTTIAFHAGRSAAFRGLRDVLSSLTDADHNLKGDEKLQDQLKARICH